ncbi:MAG TPA: acyl-CoA dehydrogenase family protein [Ramlibacter sp.]|nr:acyl-CoA dehydrogenase family protein [Ramlibacter sp.]
MNEFVEPFERLLADASTPQVVRAIEAGSSPDKLWSALDASGFADALVPEAQGGFGLALPQVFGLLRVAGRHVLPVPFGHTLFARSMLAQSSAQVPRGPIAIAARADEENGLIVCPNTPFASVAEWIVAPLRDRWLLLPKSRARSTPSGIEGSLHADLEWESASSASFTSRAAIPWHHAGAVVAAANIAGALERAFEMTLQFANDRVQFGRSIGKFQAIQHQLAVMAENVAAARMAAEMGCDAEAAWPKPLRAAVAKARASEAVALVAPLAHAIHGAIGITAELDLQLYTRRLHDWRADFGSERIWNTFLGRTLLASGEATLDFMRTELLPT